MNEYKNRPFASRLGCALRGLAGAVRSERSLRLQLIGLVATVAVLGVARVGPIWWAIVLLASAVVICAELLNTALEHLADHLHPDIHPRIRVVKDCAAAAVLIAAAGAVAVGIALCLHVIRAW